MPSPEVILKLAQEIVATKKQLAALEEEWARYFPSDTETTPANSQAPRKGGKKPDPNSAQGRIFSLVNGSPRQRYNAVEVGTLLNLDPKQAERALFKLYAAGKILRPARGIFQGKVAQVPAA